MTARYLDDFRVGERFVTGGVTVTEARALYRDLGFREITGEVADPHPELIYMALDLSGSPAPREDVA